MKCFTPQSETEGFGSRLVNSMEWISSWEADSHSVTQEIPCLMELEGSYTYKSLPLASVLGKMNAVHISKSYLFKILCNPPMWMVSLCYDFRLKQFVHFSSLSHVARPSIWSRFENTSKMWCRVQRNNIYFWSLDFIWLFYRSLWVIFTKYMNWINIGGLMFVHLHVHCQN